MFIVRKIQLFIVSKDMNKTGLYRIIMKIEMLKQILKILISISIPISLKTSNRRKGEAIISQVFFVIPLTLLPFEAPLMSVMIVLLKYMLVRQYGALK